MDYASGRLAEISRHQLAGDVDLVSRNVAMAAHNGSAAAKRIDSERSAIYVYSAVVIQCERSRRPQ